MTTEDKLDVDKLLKLSGTKSASIAMSDYIWDKIPGLTPEDQSDRIDYARNNSPDQDRDATIDRIEKRYAQEQKQEKDHEDDATAAVLDAYRIGMEAIIAGEAGELTPQGLMDSIPDTAKDDANPSAMLRLMDRVKSDSRGAPRVTNWTRYFEIEKMVRDPEQWEDFLKLDIANEPLAPSEMKDVLRWKNADLIDFLRSKIDIMKEGLIAVGLDHTKLGDLTGDAGINARAFRRRVEDELKAIPNYTKQDIQDEVDKHSIKILRDKWYGTTTVFAGTMSIEGIPDDIIDDLAFEMQEELTRRGESRPLTEIDIKDFYVSKIGPIEGYIPSWEINKRKTAPGSRGFR